MDIKDRPDFPGLYIVYINNDIIPDFRYADRKLMQWFQGEWYYPSSDQKFRGHVYQCIGPIPVLELED